MLRLILIRPGATDFDEQGRIKGSLDIPLNANGTQQVACIVDALADQEIDYVYTSPCKSAQQTAVALASGRDIKVKEIEQLQNLDHGLWHGKLIEEVRQRQPKVYRQWQEHPESVCPPQGETLDSAQTRVRKAVGKLLKKHKTGVVALIVPEPLASLVRCFLEHSRVGDLWKAECDKGEWEFLDIEPKEVLQS